MPKGAHLRRIVDELAALAPREPLGPLAERLANRIKEWFLRCRTIVRGKNIVVTGSLQSSLPLWEEHLKFLTPEHRTRLLSRILDGVPMPWRLGRPPSAPHRKFHNGTDLKAQRDVMWRTLSEQLQEGAVRVWNVRDQGLPMGLSPIKCIKKSGTDKMRIVIALCDVNSDLDPESGKCKLKTLHRERFMWEPYDWLMSADEHSGFFHYHVAPADQTWTAFSLAPNELPPGVAKRIRAKFPECYHTGTGRLFFTFAGLPQGATHSAAVYDDLSAGVLSGFVNRRAGMGRARGSQYVDDFTFAASSPVRADGSRDLYQGFKNAMHFWWRFLVTMLILHLNLNVRKMQWVPQLHTVHLGLLCSSPDLRFRETVKGAEKLRARVRDLRAAVAADARPPARLVARLVGSLWSRKLLMRRAVAIECRALTDMLAVHIGVELKPWREQQGGTMRLMKILLKRAWKGCLVWTAAAERELRFWESVDFLRQSSPMRFDEAEQQIEDFVLHPRSAKWHPQARLFAQDTNACATGMAEYSKKPGTVKSRVLASTTVPLSREEQQEHSTYLELLGVYHMLLTLVPSSAKRVVVLCDNKATVHPHIIIYYH